MHKKKTPARTSLPTKKSSKKKNNTKEKPERFPIVGIGSSAGGLEALKTFFSGIPPNANLAFVVIQHLDPKHKSIMASILSRFTDMTVVELKEGMEIEANHIYINPPNTNVEVSHRTFHLVKLAVTHGINLPIDFFFRSLSEDEGDKAICVILSGTGSDGSLGLKAIKGARGLTMAQEEKQAKFEGMPHSAIDTGTVDFILPAEKMGMEVLRYTHHPYLQGPEKIYAQESRYKSYLSKIFFLIRSQTKHDFSNYKQNTIRRRIERRMAVQQLEKIADYYRYLEKTPAEVEILFKELLIGVTNFFRDKYAFEIIRQKVLPAIVEQKQNDSPLRIWVPGCATGEEAFSLAMLLEETMDEMGKQVPVQIFATDIDAEAIEFGRKGVYPASIAADVPQAQLKRFFLKVGATYKIKKKIRECVVFATQNVIKDPPFSKLDMISCRNLFIYLDRVLQKKILPVFHYVIVEDGYLMLGPSENVTEFADRFITMDAKWKIFKRKGPALEKSLDYSFLSQEYQSGIQKVGDEKKTFTEINLQRIGAQLLLDRYAPSAVLVNEHYEILFFYGKTDAFLSTPIGEAKLNILRMARDSIIYKLAAGIKKAFTRKTIVEIEGLQIQKNGHIITFDMVIRPVKEGLPSQDLVLVTFEEQRNESGSKRKSLKKMREERGGNARMATLENELKSTKEYLQSTVEELETSNEELKSTNEELQSTNEELQSTNEEVETSKEELQSTNEELITVNSELQIKVDELSKASNELNNLMASTEIGHIFLDRNLRVKRFTPATVRIFNLIQSDIDRPISDITSTIRYNHLYEDAQEVLQTLSKKESHVRNKAGNWYEMQILPYRTTENVIDGVVLTFVDITKLKLMEQSFLDAESRCHFLFKETHDGLVTIQAKSGAIQECNATFADLTGRTMDELKNLKIWSLCLRSVMEPTKQKFIKIFEKAEEAITELEIQKTDGTVVKVEFQCMTAPNVSDPCVQCIVREKKV